MAFYVILILSAFAGSVITSGIYGDIGNIHTNGASCRTARQDRLPNCGVQASFKLAEHDLARVNKYKNMIQSAARNKQVDPAVLAGIISRETRGGNVLHNGWGDHNNGFGLMQVDKRYHTLQGAWNSETHLLQGADILISMINGIKRKFPSASKEKVLLGGIAAYNCGVSGVTSLENVDRKTTGVDYGNDVVARAQYFRNHGYN
ncbi:lysozyme g-like [Pseudophryne corroboree]|uniref:lysozyme g-like n=1 Tax=Pseudophryne corroboree TaxID=495146 RepID=UPI00308197F4